MNRDRITSFRLKLYTFIPTEKEREREKKNISPVYTWIIRITRDKAYFLTVKWIFLALISLVKFPELTPSIFNFYRRIFTRKEKYLFDVTDSIHKSIMLVSLVSNIITIDSFLSYSQYKIYWINWHQIIYKKYSQRFNLNLLLSPEILLKYITNQLFLIDSVSPDFFHIFP